jgi:beta-glucosidase/6-phospho-beta-glucosidase/beta-galactosidase
VVFGVSRLRLRPARGDRIRYLDGHLRAARKAIGLGVDLRGYLVWSLLDNDEREDTGRREDQGSVKTRAA